MLLAAQEEVHRRRPAPLLNHRSGVVLLLFAVRQMTSFSDRFIKSLIKRDLLELIMAKYPLSIHNTMHVTVPNDNPAPLLLPPKN